MADKDKLSSDELSIHDARMKLTIRQHEEEARMLLEFRERCFEVQKHVATLSTAASLVILAVYRERPFEERLLAFTLILLGLSAVIAVYGMTFQADKARYRADSARTQTSHTGYDFRISLTTTLSSNCLIYSVVALAFYLLHIPFGLMALGVLGIVFVTLRILGRVLIRLIRS